MGSEATQTAEVGPGTAGPGGAPSQEPLSGCTVDRYLLLDEIGRGGMGTVYRARDMELDRDVALKVVSTASTRRNRAVTRLHREARALARLNHPNVVPVFDVLERAGQVYIAMEFVRGRTLRKWLADRPPWRDILEVMIGAGRGLAAAHAAGLVHRDFKPSNVMISDARPGETTRVRVLDFGLARRFDDDSSSEQGSVPPSLLIDPLDVEITKPGVVLGTPRYMAPEQQFGRTMGASADQYAFCLTLWEGLAGEFPFASREYAELFGEKVRPTLTIPGGTQVPARVWAAVQRGLKPHPKLRWPSLEVLLDELIAASRVRRRWWVLGIPVVVGAAVAAIAGPKPRDCVDAGDAMSDGWQGVQRGRVRASLVAGDQPFAADTASRVTALLDGYSEEWMSTHAELCASSPSSSDASFDYRMACLRDARVEFEATVDVLSGELTDPEVRGAVRMAGALPRLTDCEDRESVKGRLKEARDPDTLRADAELRTKGARARVLGRAGQYEDAAQAWSRLVARAEHRASPAVLAELQYEHGRALERAGRPDEALATLDRAFVNASAIGYEQIAFASASHLMYLHAVRKRDFDAAQRWRRHTEAFLERIRLLPLSEAMYAQNLAVMLQLQGQFEEAVEYHARALSLYRRELGDDHIHVASSLNNLGVLYWERGDYDRAAELYSESLEIKESIFGPDHPVLTSSLNNAAIALHNAGRHDEAIALHERTLVIKENTLGRDHPAVANTLSNFANVLVDAGRVAEARVHYLRAIDILESNHADKPQMINPLQGLGQVLVELGEPSEARAVLERSIAICEATEKPLEAASGRFQLARALFALAEDRDYALSLAREAHELHAQAGGRHLGDAAEIADWLRVHEGTVVRDR